MADTMKGLKRTCYCNELDRKDIGKEVVVGGWVQKQRDKGPLVFIDLRDRTGIVQLTFDENTQKEVFDKAKSVKPEYVLMAKGTVIQREAVNHEIKTGEIEISVTDLRILSYAQTPPFPISDQTKVNDEIRLKYRYLDLRRKSLQDNLIMRHEIARVAREYFYENGFLEIETPMMMKSTPEGARDYLIPSVFTMGSFTPCPSLPDLQTAVDDLRI